MKDSLEVAVENYFIELLRASAALKGKTIRNGDSQQDAKANCIIIEATKGEDLLEGPRGPGGELRSNVEAMITYRTNAGPRENDVTRDGILNAIKAAGSTPTKAQRDFGRLDIFLENMTSERTNSGKIRVHTLKIPLEVGMA